MSKARRVQASILGQSPLSPPDVAQILDPTRTSLIAGIGVWPYGSRLNYTMKRALDVVLAGLGLLVLSPLMLLVAAMIRLESKGPVLFRQKRLGLTGQPFLMNKFRTMVAEAEGQQTELEARNEAQGGILFKIRDDPRITPLGRFLRRTSLDELPQLFNILAGQMSVVGPRPLPMRDSALLEELHPREFALRLDVLPGLTGPWQVSGRSDVGVGSMFDLDIAYAERWSLRRDLVLILRTCVVVVWRNGAY